MSEKKRFKIYVVERYGEETEFVGTKEELEVYLWDYDINKSSANFDFSYEILEEKEVENE